MTLSGYIRDGKIIVEPGGDLPEGAAVRIEVLIDRKSTPAASQTLGRKLMKHAGKAKGLPPDASRNHDHYLYGTPRK
jgi:hypothetical protein